MYTLTMRLQYQFLSADFIQISGAEKRGLHYVLLGQNKNLMLSYPGRFCLDKSQRIPFAACASMPYCQSNCKNDGKNLRNFPAENPPKVWLVVLPWYHRRQNLKCCCCCCRSANYTKPGQYVKCFHNPEKVNKVCNIHKFIKQ